MTTHKISNQVIKDGIISSMSSNPMLQHMNRILRTMNCEACNPTETNCQCPCGQSQGTCDCPDCPDCRDKKHTCSDKEDQLTHPNGIIV
jgi:hypothetical protein